MAVKVILAVLHAGTKVETSVGTIFRPWMKAELLNPSSAASPKVRTQEFSSKCFGVRACSLCSPTQ